VNFNDNQSDKSEKLRVLILYDPNSTHIPTVYEYLVAFKKYSRNEISFSASTSTAQAELTWDLSLFDVVVLHYSIRICYDWHMSRSFFNAIEKFEGLKVQFIQDEYDNTELSRSNLIRLGINLVFTCVPQDQIEFVYPAARFPNVDFIPILTGYVPLDVNGISQYAKPYEDRTNLIGYRGRELPFWYGSLGRDKFRIGVDVKNFCSENNINHDIEWTEDKRIYGDDWFRFIGSCVATLGSPSGSNLFDFDGKVRRQIEELISHNDSLTYEDVYDKYLRSHDNKIQMAQISPRVFESIALRSVLVLYEGTYSGVIEPDLHYLPLKKDLSNAHEIKDRLRDKVFVNLITESAYQHVIISGHYSYASFIQLFDRQIYSRAKKVARGRALYILAGVESTNIEKSTPFPHKGVSDWPLSWTRRRLEDELYANGIPTHLPLAPPARADNGTHKAFPHSISYKVEPNAFSSSLQFIEGYDLSILYDQSAKPDHYVSACEGQLLPQIISISLNKPENLDRIVIEWYDDNNHPTDLAIRACMVDQRIEEARFVNMQGANQEFFVEFSGDVSLLHLILFSFKGQQRLLLRKIDIWSFSHPHIVGDKKYRSKRSNLITKGLRFFLNLITRP
jgi:hypothetical protein